MANSEAEEASLRTVREDLARGFADLGGEVRTGFADLKVTLISSFQGLPTREWGDEMLRLLRENNRLQEERFTRLDVRIREQHLEIQQVLRALVEGQHLLVEGQHVLVEGQRALVEGQQALLEGLRALSEEIRSLSFDIKALIARLDALIQGRGDGSPAS